MPTDQSRDDNVTVSPVEAVRLFCLDYYGCDENRVVRLLRDRKFGDRVILSVLHVIEDCCHHCWKGGPRCQCNNDE